MKKNNVRNNIRNKEKNKLFFEKKNQKKNITINFFDKINYLIFYLNIITIINL